jgi:alcohol dehydrogenase
MIDLDDNRLLVAKRFGATATVSAAGGMSAELVMKMTGGRGVDTAIEAVGVAATFITCEDIVAPGGTIANIGVVTVSTSRVVMVMFCAHNRSR